MGKQFEKLFRFYTGRHKPGENSLSISISASIWTPILWSDKKNGLRVAVIEIIAIITKNHSYNRSIERRILFQFESELLLRLRIQYILYIQQRERVSAQMVYFICQRISCKLTSLK